MKMGGFFSYVFNMPCEKIFADLGEYFRLRKEYSRVDAQTKKMQESLTVDNQFSCANYVETGRYNIFGESDRRIQYCENFFHKDCTQAECPRMKEHNEYWALMEKRKQLMTAKAEFWDAKFQNAR